MRAQLARDFERFGEGLPRDFAGHIREAYRIDLAARYLGFPLPHPIGKGSGQLSLNQEQLENDRAAGLAFVVIGFGAVALGRDPNGLANLAFGLGRRVERLVGPRLADRLPRLPGLGRDPAEDEAVAAHDGSGEPVSARDYVAVHPEEVGAHAAARG